MRLPRWARRAKRTPPPRWLAGRGLAEALEARILLDAVPTVALDAPAEARVGETFQVSVTFENQDTDPGFAPFIDLVLPTTGVDGDDGVSFVSAQLQSGFSLSSTVLTFDAAGEALHPLAVDNADNPVVVTGTPGDTLLVLQLPFGSFVPGQTPVVADVTLQMSELADEGVALDIQARGGFALGCDPQDDPTSDPSTFSPFVTDAVVPTVFDIEKTSNVAEGETVTGPNHPVQWRLAVDIADGQTLTDFTLVDTLSENFAFVSLDSFTAGGVVVSTPPVGVPYEPGVDPVLEIEYASITGGPGTEDLVVLFTTFVPEDTFAGTPILDPVTGADTIATNNVAGDGTWDPIDPRDPIQTVNGADTGQVTAKASAIQKTNTLFVDNNAPGPSPGDIIQFTIDLQVSDFFTLGDLQLDDQFSDGLRFTSGGGFDPVFSVMERDGTFTSRPFGLGNVSVSGGDAATPVQSVQFAFSTALDAQPGHDDLLQGGLATGLPNQGPTTAQLVYYGEIQDAFDGATPGNPQIGQGDSFRNDAELEGTIRDNLAPGTPLGPLDPDDSNSEVGIPTGAIDKDVYAVNGVIGAPATVAPGDTLTFRIRYTLPLSSLEDYEIVDYLPLPLLDATTVTTFAGGAPSPVAPAAGTASYGPTDTFSLIAGAPDPTLVSDATVNTLTFDYGSFDTGANVASTIDLLFTLLIADVDFSDQLQLTNVSTAFENDTQLGTSDATAGAQFQYGQPELGVTKGVVATDNGAGAFTPGTVGPSGFTAPGSPGVRFVPVFGSTGLLANPVDSDLADVDAGDLVSFAIVIENTGTGRNGAFDIQVSDTLPVGFAIPTAGSGLNLTVTDGAGAAIAFTDLGGGIFGSGIELVDPGPTATPGALDPADPANGRNIAVITYDLELADTVAYEVDLTNTATVARFAALEGGANRAADLEDDATVSTAAPTLTKVVTSTSRPDTGSGQLDPTLEDLAIEEEVTFQITFTLPEGSDTLSLVDQLPTNPPGVLSLVSAQVVSVGANVAGISVGDLPAVADGNGDGFDDLATWNFGTVTNTPDNVADTDDQVVVEVVARLEDIPQNRRRDVLTNTATLSWAAGDASDTERVEVVEPLLRVAKRATPSVVDGGDVVDYRVRVRHSGASLMDAYDVVVEDLLADPDLTLVAGSVTTTAGTIVTGNGPGDTTIRVDLSVLPLGTIATIRYQAQVSATVASGDVLPNTAAAEWDQIPGPGGRVGQHDRTAQVTVSSPDIAKTVVSTSRADTGTDRLDPTLEDLAIGEEVVFEVRLSLAEGTTPLILTDQLPVTPGVLGFVSGAVTFIGGNVSGGIALGQAPTATNDTNADTFLDQIIWDFGSLVNTPDGSQDANDEIAVEIRARVEDVPANTNAIALVNTATADFGTGTAQDQASVEVVEPELTITKTPSSTTVVGGNTVTYTVDVAHDAASNMTAYDLVIEDPFTDGRLALVVGSVTTTLGTVTTGNTAGDTTVRVDLASLTLTQNVQITFDAVVTPPVFVGDTIPNTADLDWDDLPGAGGRPGTDDASAAVVVDTPTVEKTITDTSVPETGTGQGDPTIPDVAIGETVTYELTAFLVDGADQAVLLIDQLPTGPEIMSVVSARVLFVGADITEQGTGNPVPAPTITISDTNTDGFDDRVTFDFGIVTNPNDGASDVDDSIVVEVVALVEDAPGNLSGVVLENTLDFGSGTDDDDEQVEIVEPELVIDKSAVLGVDGLVTYTVVVSHDPASVAPVFDLVVTDDLADPNLALVAGTVTTTRGTVDLGNTGGDTTIEVDVGRMLLTESVTITYQAQTAGATPVDLTIDNTAVANWNTVPGGGRADTDQDTESIVVAVPEVDKVVADTSIPETGTGQGDPALDDLTIGEEVTSQITVTAPEGPTDIVLSDLLPLAPGVLAPVSSRVVSIGAGLSLAGGPVDSVGDSGTVSGSTVTFDFGTVTNATTDDAITPDDLIVVEVVAVVTDVAANVAGLTLTNQAQVDFTGPKGTGSDTDDAQVELVEPELDIQKTAALAANGVVDYTLVVSHPGGSSAPAFDVVVTDLLADADLALVVGTVTTTRGTVALGNTPGDTTIRVDAGTLLLGESVTVTYQGMGVGLDAVDTVIDNTGHVDWGSSPGNGRPGTDTDDAQVILAIPEVTKAVFDTSIPETGTGQHDPALPDLTVGEEVTFEIVVAAPEGDTAIVLTDALPTTPGILTPISGAVVAIGAGLTLSGPVSAVGDPGVVGGANIVFDFGTVTNASTDDLVTAADQIVVRVVGRVDDLPANMDADLLTNTATVDYTGPKGSGSESDAAQVEIVEPLLEIDKTASVGADGLVTYTLQITQDPASTAAAFDVVVADALADPNLDLIVGSVTTTLGTVALGNTAGDTTVRVEVPTLLLGQTVTVTYQGQVSGITAVDLDVANTGRVDWGSTPGNGRPGNDTDTEIVTLAAPELDKIVAGSSVAETGTAQFDPTLDDLVIGEQVRFEITIAAPEGPTDIVLTDLLPTFPGVLTPVSSQVLAVGGALTLGGPVSMVGDPGQIVGFSVVFDFGTVTNASTDDAITPDDQIVVEVVAEVADVGANAAGDVLTNRANLTYVGPKGSGSDSDQAQVEVVEPELLVTKGVSPTVVDQGGVVTYTVVVGHGPDSTAPLFDVVVTDPLVAGLVLLPGSVTTTLGTVVVGNGPGDATIEVQIARLLLEPTAEEATIQYQARVTGRPGASLPNVATVDLDSLPGPGGRPDQGSDDAVVRVRPLDPPPVVPPEPPSIVPPGFGTNVFNDQSLSPTGERLFARRFFESIRPPPSPWTLDPIYSGAAQPGTTVQLQVVDRRGAISTSQSVVADMGGNWMLRLPHSASDDAARTLEQVNPRLQGSQLLRLSHVLPATGVGLLGFLPASPEADVGARFFDEPYRVRMIETPPIFDADPQGGSNLRTYYAPILNPGQHVERPPTLDGATAQVADHALTLRQLGAEEPLESLAWNKFNDEFLAASATPDSR